jgi:hypothetical protein
MSDVDTLFTEENRLALKTFNDICSNIRGEYSKDAVGLFRIWTTTLTIYEENKENSMSQLLSALLKLKPHWNKYIESFNTDFKKIIMYFYKCCKSLEPLAKDYYSNNHLASYQGQDYIFPNSSNDNNYCCLTFSNKKIKISKPICDSCHLKLKKQYNTGVNNI